ncbi:hypothetical protein ACPYO6_04805 [Georgenia sp. Z1344]|uniref:hypothetical protein n=1 Tax=Georgenia sp. Z1344 TaxID=3416706 RepID=UPI003CEB5A0B
MPDRRDDPTTEELTGTGEALAGDPAQREEPGDRPTGRPSQAEGEDPSDAHSEDHPEPPGGHPSQAEGEPEDGP